MSGNSPDEWAAPHERSIDKRETEDGRHLPGHAVMWAVVNGLVCRKQHAPGEPHKWERAEFTEAQAEASKGAPDDL